MSSVHNKEALIVYQESPHNAAPPLEKLVENFITPTEHFFVRNHGSVPEVNPAEYLLTIDGLVSNPLRLSLDQIKNEFHNFEWIATIQCAGNRRAELQSVMPIEDELPWGASAIGNALWKGVSLSSILERAGLDIDKMWDDAVETGLHVVFHGLDEVTQGGDIIHYATSLPLEIAIWSNTKVVHEMNGAALTPDHGYPLRVIVPDQYGARSVKWLSHITIQNHPSDNYFQQRAYKSFPPQVRAENADWNNAPPLGKVPLNSAICVPQDGETLLSGTLSIRGYGSGGFVELSTDGGATWTATRLSAFPDNGALYSTWYLWECELTLPAGTHEISARARDEQENIQPEHLQDVWNFKGYANNAWHRITVHIS